MVSRELRFSLLAGGLLIATQALAADMYCCQDPVSGRRVCADIVPEVCKSHGYKVIDGAGNVIKEVGPPLTAEQKAAKAVEAKRKQEMEAVLREQKRKDSALLESYASIADIDNVRARAEAEIQSAITSAEKKLEDARKRRTALTDEAEFYKKREMPSELARSLRESDSEIASLANVIESKQKDLEAIRAKFTEDRRRYLEITGRGNSNGSSAASGNTRKP